MKKTYRVGVAGLVHDHVWGEIKAWQAREDVEIVAAGDVNARLRERFQTALPNAVVYESWEAMLEGEGDRLDIVQGAAENNVHAEIVEACAARGIHVILEKPMAATLDQAQRMARAASDAGTRLMINWPTEWNAPYQELERRILAGDIGDVRYFKYRSAHNGPKEIGCDPTFYEWLYDAEKNGAGALMDYCGYGAAMCARFLGRPTSVTGIRAVLAKDYPLPDDNALIAAQYPHAFGVCEASWTQVVGYVAPNLVVYGSEGGLCVWDGKVHLSRKGQATEIIAPPAPIAPRRSAPEYLLHCLGTQSPIEGACASDVSLIGQEILEAGLRASNTGQAQTLPLGD